MLALVADDNSGVCRLIRALCSRAGLDALSCSCGQELVEAARLLRPPVIISDLHMPGKPDGLQACLVLRRELPGTKFILMTGDPTSLPALRDAGFNLILNKPLHMAEVIDLISAVACALALMQGQT